MQTLLLPVDGSPSALRAVRYVTRLASGQSGLQVHLLNVQPPLLAGDISLNGSIEAALRAQDQAGRDAIGGARKVLDANGVACTEHLAVGDTAGTIAQVARDQGVDGIVMGTRGMGPLKGLMLGSIATRVIHLVKVPVTLVK